MKLHKGKGYTYHLTIKTFKYKAIAKKKKTGQTNCYIPGKFSDKVISDIDFIKDVSVVQCDVPVVKSK